MKNIKEDQVTCEFLRQALDTARDTAMENMDVDGWTHVGKKGTGESTIPCAAAELGCKKKIKVILTASKITEENPHESGEKDGFDVLNGTKTIQTNGSPCELGDMK